MEDGPYIYRHTESSPQHDLYTVGFYAPDGEWHPESDHESADDAAERVHYLNGGDEM
jgi:hypothetical protein